ncbi:MAG TPA: ABC transporter substrate-binding protein [Acidimicrobiales bacterium]
MHPRSRLRRWRSLVAVGLAVALLSAACGDDDDDGGAQPGTTEPGATTTSEAPGEPVRGGSATILMFSEIGTLDPVRMTASGGSDGQRGFALYGGLVVFDPEQNETVPLLAESFEPSADFRTWTLKLKPGLTFTDGTPFDAEAVKVNWERAQDVNNRSPSLTTLLPVQSMTVQDPQTLVIQLNAPNAHFDNAIARVGANYIASADAIRKGTDFTSTAIGAGPYILESWLRDDRMELRANPDWKGSEGPYLERLTFRVVGDEDQRIDTFITGQADAFYTSTPASVARAQESVEGAEYASVRVTNGQTFIFNLAKPPFDDIRVRQAYAMGVDWQALAETVFGEGSVAPYNFTLEGTPWFTPDATLPEYDPAEAQRLINEYVAEHGGQPIEIVHTAFQQTLDQARVEFVQTSLNQLDNINVEVDVNDSPTNIQNVLAGNFMVSSWGFPMPEMDPGLYNSVHSASFNNYSEYKNPEVDAWIEQARATDDLDTRVGLYQNVFRALARDIPFYPYVETVNGFVTSPDLHGGKVYEDGILRFDLLWKSQ